MGQLPKMLKVMQRLEDSKVENIKGEITKELEKCEALKKLSKGSKIAITAGSRGISGIAEVLKEVSTLLKEKGAKPFIVPAMGSHGGGDAKGQIKVLRSLGITKQSTGAPISESDETMEIGQLENGFKVFLDKKAFESDGIIVINRIKPHTSFRADIESGLTKMMVVGLGRKDGAKNIHQHGVKGLIELIPKVGSYIVEKAPIIFGLALVENGHGELATIKGLEPKEILKEEKKLLVKAKKFLPTLPFDKIDFLIVGEMGKCFSGTGMDTNVIGRIRINGQEEPKKPNIKRISVLDLAKASHGNANGIGLADFTTKRLVKKIDFKATYTNILSNTFFQRAAIPITFDSDEECIKVGLETLRGIDPLEAKIVWIPNTLDLKELWVSKGMLEEIKKMDNLYVTDEEKDFTFNGGTLDYFNKN